MVVLMAKEKSTFLTAPIIKEILKWVRLMVQTIFLFILTDLFIEVLLLTLRKMDMEQLIIIQASYMKEHGKMEFLMDKVVNKLMLMEVFIKEHFLMELNKAMGVINGRMVKYIKGSSKMELQKVEGYLKCMRKTKVILKDSLKIT